MHVIGLTGGIASGKSLVAAFLKQLGAEIIDADAVGHQVIMPGKPAYGDLIETFGRAILNEDGTVDRKKLGAVVFDDPEKLRLLNKITHLRIFIEIEEKLNSIRGALPHTVVVVEAALLFEIGLDSLVDEIWVVEADPEVQVRRLMKRNNLTEEEAWDRVNAQMPSVSRIARADRVVYNNSGVEELFRKVLEIWERDFG